MLGVYLSVLMAETCLSIMLTISVLRLHHAGPDETEMSPMVRRLVFGWLARLVGSAAGDRPRRTNNSASCHSAANKLTSPTPGQMN